MADSRNEGSWLDDEVRKYEHWEDVRDHSALWAMAGTLLGALVGITAGTIMSYYLLCIIYGELFG